MQAVTDRGSALILALGMTILLAALGLGVVTVTDAESRIAQNFRGGYEALNGADAAMERALVDLFAWPVWSGVPSGAQLSTFIGPTRRPTLPLRGQIDLDRITTQLQIRSNAAWQSGANNPVWHLFAYGPIAALAAAGEIQSDVYLAVWVADDPSEIDDDPAVDRNDVLMLTAQAFGPGLALRSVASMVSRTASGGLGRPSILSWREVR
jgi:hypothetical protein